VTGTVPGHGSVTGSAGLIEINLEGKTTFAYCIEVLEDLLKGSSNPMDASPWSSANVPNLPNIQRILQQHPAEATLAKTDATAANQEAAAVQSAIWHFSDAFDLTKAVTRNQAQTDQTTQVKALYDQIVADAAAHPVSEPKAELTLTPATHTASAGQEAGPFTVATTATTPLALSTTGGTAEIRDCATHAVKTTAVDGDKLCLFQSSAGGPVTLNATGQATVDAGRVFINKSRKSQEIILAGTKSVDVKATAAATWTAAATTTTTAPGTTTTTAPGS